MTALAYIIYLFILLPLSLLPLRFLYLLSDGIAWLLFVAIGYRKQVIHQNITQAFPQASPTEIDQIKRKFYQQFCDVFFAEMIKSLSPSAAYLDQMMQLKNPELLNQLHQQNKGVILVCGHFGNWELTAHLAYKNKIKHRVMAIYKPQSTVANLVLGIARTKTNAELVAMDKVSRSFIDKRTFLPVYIFAADQSPANPQNAYWLNFLNQETGVMLGAERMAIKFDYPVVYLELLRVKRGRYELTFTLVTDNPKTTEPGEITTKHTGLLEQSILKSPGSWLWSHRRWKHKNPTSA